MICKICFCFAGRKAAFYLGYYTLDNIQTANNGRSVSKTENKARLEAQAFANHR